ncbi:hypothetical protein EST38_g12495 [Candolleomyces aberdarensis]|uniref:Uncharacterized protein n=1 Tax=Candolleomyces aberdarensis TaxID=2316362 RepID=A0A4Q2D3E8_9AGAR|nr:hypothetical protein EST38_g12495 [Candolleomyces aberdarensis]
MAPKPAPKAPTAPASKARNKGGTSQQTAAPSHHDVHSSSKESSDEDSDEDSDTPHPQRRPSRPPSRALSTTSARFSPYPTAADRTDIPSSDDQLNAPVFSPDPSRPFSQHALGGMARSLSSASGQRRTAATTDWTDEGRAPPGNWDGEDVSMSGVPTAVPSRETTAAPGGAHGAYESAQGLPAQRAWAQASYSPADVAEAMSIAALWFGTSAPPREEDTVAWSAVRSIQSNLHQLVTNIRQSDWSHAITIDRDDDGDHTARRPIHPPKPSKGKERAPPSPRLPPSDDPEMQGLEYGSRTPSPRLQELHQQRPKAGRVEPRPLPAAPIVPFQRTGPPPRPPRSSLRPTPRRIEARGGRKPAPAPIPAATYAATASRAPKAPTAKAVDLVYLARAAPAASPQAIVRIHEEQTGNASRKKGKPSFTSHGPSHKQVLVQFGGPDRCPSIAFIEVQKGVNGVLVQRGSSLRIESVDNAYGGWTLKTNGVANQGEIDLIRGAIIRKFPDSNPWVGLPQSTSYLKIRGVPRFSDDEGTVPTTPDDIVRAME